MHYPFTMLTLSCLEVSWKVYLKRAIETKAYADFRPHPPSSL